MTHTDGKKMTKQFTQRATLVATALVFGVTLALTGCGMGIGGGSNGGSTAVTGAAKLGLHGNAHGGQQPLSNGTVQLYAVGTTGNGSAATPLITSMVTTDINGNFNITNDYTCPTNSMVYLAVTGGNPGISSTTNNTAIALMAGLGSCATLQANAANISIQINELTTAATIFALGGFATGYANIGYASGNMAGMTTAFTTQNVLVNYSTGGSPGLTSTGVTIPSTLLNTIADSIAACVNTASSTSSQCAALFTAATPSGGSAPTDTVAALANIAHNPALNVTSIFNLSNTTPPFQPQLVSAPTSLAITLKYTGGGLSLPNGVALDGTGNAWIANQGGNAVTEIGPGAFVSGTSGYSSTSVVGAQAIAVDASNNVWLANTGANNVLELSSTGAIAKTLTSGISAPVSVAIDGSGQIWVANFDNNSLSAFTSAGSPIAGSPFTNTALTAPTGVAIDASNNVWVTSSTANSVVQFNNSGAFQSSFTDGLLIAPGGIATDTTNNRVWVAATGINAISALTTAGSVAGGPFVGGGISQPLYVAVDSLGTLWTANNATAGIVTALSTTGVSLQPTALASLNQPTGLALDASGNLWVTSAGDNSVTEFIGLAAPTVTPLVASTR